MKMSAILLFSILAFLSLSSLGQEIEQDAAAMPEADQMQQMQARMQVMRAQMERIHRTEDPEERQRLMHEHMQSMHDAMTMMGRVMRGPMPQGQTCQQNDTECRIDQTQMQQRMMGQRMGMMQQMMEQMMEQMMRGQGSVGGEAEDHDEHH